MSAIEIKLPKSFRHWITSAGLSMNCSPRTKRNRWSPFSLIGRGRHWRVNCNGTFDMSEVYKDFDRWANSREATFDLPKSKAEFIKLVKSYKGLKVEA